MDIKPLRDNVVIQPDKDDSKTESGIMLAREWKKLPHTGTVLSVGPEVKVLGVGDRVWFHRYAFHKITDDAFIGLEKSVAGTL